MIENHVIFCPGLFVGGTNLYQERTKLPELMDKHCYKGHIKKRTPFIALEQAAKELYSFLRTLDKFHLIGHSRGGIEARMVLSMYPELWTKCLSLITIGSPHKGSPIADLFIEHNNKACAYVFDHLFNVAGKGAKEIVAEMTTKHMSKINEDLRPIEGVPCFSMPFIVDKEWKLSAFDKFNWNLMQTLGHHYSDGVVTLDSQLFGTPIGKHQFGNFAINYGSHKAQTLPFRSGVFPWSTIWKQTFVDAFNVMKSVEKNHALLLK